MPAPDYAWLDQAELLDFLGSVAAGESATDVDQARRAAAAYVESVKPSLVYAGAVPADMPANVIAGAQLYAARLLARRSSPGGVASFGEFGPAAVLRSDPDVDRLLGLGRYAAPQVG